MDNCEIMKQTENNKKGWKNYDNQTKIEKRGSRGCYSIQMMSNIVI